MVALGPAAPPSRAIATTAGRGRRLRARAAVGFTLMEMLVTLVLVSMATMLMFQMLGSYRVSLQRVQARSGVLDRQVLFDDWFRDSVHGLFIDKGLAFAGGERAFSGISLNPLFATEGAPTPIEWRLDTSGGQTDVVYVEAGRERWRLPLSDRGEVHFAYLDQAGRVQATWPPKLGKQDDLLPAVVVLVRPEAAGQRTIAAAVLGPLRPIIRLTGEEAF